MFDSTLSTEDLFLVLYCFIDELYLEAAPRWVRNRPGTARASMTDAEIITLSVVQEGRSNDSERSFHRRVHADYRHLFPDLIERSRYHRRRKALMGIQREMLAILMKRARLTAAWFLIDSAPVLTAKSPRWKSARMSIWPAEAGYCASKRQFFLGFRLHVLTSETGALCDWVLSPANVGERRVAEHLLRAAGKGPSARPVLADNGYCGDWLKRLFAKRGGQLWYGLRPSQKPTSVAEEKLRRWHRGLRARIESVFGALEGQFNLQRTLARSIWGVMTRIVAKLLAYMLGVVVNEALGRKPTDLKGLYL